MQVPLWFRPHWRRCACSPTGWHTSLLDCPGPKLGHSQRAETGKQGTGIQETPTWVLTKSAGKPSLGGLVEHTGKPSGESMELTRKLPSRVLPIRKSHIRQSNSSSGVPKADTYGQVPGCWGGAPVIILYINCGKLTLQFSPGVLYSGAMATFKKFIVSNGYKDSGDSCIS